MSFGLLCLVGKNVGFSFLSLLFKSKVHRLVFPDVYTRSGT